MWKLERDELEFARGAVDLVERGSPVAWFHDSAGDREPLRRGVAVRGDLVVDSTRVGNPVRPQVTVPGNHERLLDPAFAHDAQPIGELDPCALFGVQARFFQRAPECVERTTDVVVNVEDVEAERGDRIRGATGGRSHRVSSGQSSQRGVAHHQRTVSLRQVVACPLGERDQVGVRAVVGLRIVRTPDEPFRTELGDEPVDDLGRATMSVGLLQHVRGDLEVEVGVLGETEERGSLRVRRASVELDEAAVVEDHRLVGKLLEDALRAAPGAPEGTRPRRGGRATRTPPTART